MSNIVMVWSKGEKVMIGTASGHYYSLEPALAVKLAQSLLRKAKEADPTMDVDVVAKAYRDMQTKEVH